MERVSFVTDHSTSHTSFQWIGWEGVEIHNPVRDGIWVETDTPALFRPVRDGREEGNPNATNIPCLTALLDGSSLQHSGIYIYRNVGNASEPLLKCFVSILIQRDQSNRANFVMHS